MIETFNIQIKIPTKKRLFDLLEKNENLKVIIPVNAELIVLANENKKFLNVINRNYATIDGQIPYFFIKLKHSIRDVEKLSGSDLIYDLSFYAEKNNLKVFLLGGLEKSNYLARKKLKKLYPKLIIDGYSPPYYPYPFPKKVNEIILNKLENFKPDILFVAFGAPKQEYWIEDNKKYLEKLNIKLAMGVGGAFEMVAGVEKRAPKLIQRMGLESLWRLIQNPKRFRRFIRNFKFFKYALK